MSFNRKDVCVAVTNDGKMLVAQGTGIQSMFKKYEGRVSDTETIYYSQLRYRSIKQVNGEWLICKGKDGIGVTFQTPPHSLRGGIYLEFTP